MQSFVLLTCTSIDFSATFEVLVGGNTPIPKLFTLNRELFCQRSGFFEAATSSTWLKDPTKPVELPDCSVDDFRAYLQCAYSNEVAVLDGVFSEKTAEAYANALVVLWILTDYLQDCTAANTIFEEFIDIHYARSLVPSALTMTMIYELTSAGCPLRRLMVDYCVHEKDLASEPHLVKGLPRELLEDIAIANSTVKQLRIRRIVSTQGDVPIVPSSRARGGHRCRYHRHAEKNAGCK